MDQVDQVLADPGSTNLLMSLLPTPAAMVAGTIFNLIGIWLYYRGRKAGNRKFKWIAIALIVYPLLVAQTWLICLLGSLLCLVAYLSRNE